MTYKYKCDHGHIFEVEQKISEDPLKKCLECGSLCKRVPFTGTESNGGFTINGYSYKNGYA